MPRWMAHLLIVVGWLLTPAWAWAASHVGLWLGALVALRLSSPVLMLAIAGASAFLCGRSKVLVVSLAVAGEGICVFGRARTVQTLNSSQFFRRSDCS